MILKQLVAAMLLFVSLLSCHNESKPMDDKNDNSANRDTLAYPFTASYSLKWQPGGQRFPRISKHGPPYFILTKMKHGSLYGILK
jgi:hypothetical protein